MYKKEYLVELYGSNGWSNVIKISGFFSTMLFILRHKVNCYIVKHITKFLDYLVDIPEKLKRERFRIRYGLSRERMRKLETITYGIFLKELMDFDNLRYTPDSVSTSKKT